MPNLHIKPTPVDLEKGEMVIHVGANAEFIRLSEDIRILTRRIAELQQRLVD